MGRGEQSVISVNQGSTFTSSPYLPKRKAIALLITLFFIIAITVAVGLSLTQLQKGQEQLVESRFQLQNSVVIDDVLSILKTTLKSTPIEDADSLSLFLDSTALIPLEAEGLRVKIAIQSARSKININTISGSAAIRKVLNEYLLRYNIQNSSYLVDLMVDSMNGEKEIYLTDLFYERPWLYRDRIAGKEHLSQILDFYVQTQHDNSVEKVPWDALFRFGEHNTTGIDANYIKAEVWQLMLPQISFDEAKNLEKGSMMQYGNQNDLGLSEDELRQLSIFNISYYLPTVYVNVAIEENNSSAEISFEYDVNTKKAKEFMYGI